ncbi:MAG: hypothetical protein LUE16_02985 [Lachnospiraceae bacterium]|nr:hypothetical protein [Lachnospiraceae bacterium]
MLTIKAPIELKCGKALSSSYEAFAQRIEGNYQLTAAQMEREDLLHVVMAPPEIYLGGGGNTSILQDTRIQNNRETRLEVINNLLNRISVTEEVNLTYQDRVYITDVLYKLGVTNANQFMRQVSLLKQETQNVRELTDLYWNHLQELNRTVEEYESSSVDQRTTQASYDSQTRLYLHEDIMNRLKTGAVYQILNNFYSRPEGNSPQVSGSELTFSEQQRTVSRILLNRLQSQAVGRKVPLEYRHENYYEETRLEGPQVTQEAVNSQITSAILLNLADSLYQNLSEKNIRSNQIWVHVERALYQTAENTLKRISYAMSEQSAHVDVRQEITAGTVSSQERELETLREILTLGGRKETRWLEGPEGWTADEPGIQKPLPPADISYPESDFEQEPESPQMPQTETERRTREVHTETLKKTVETLSDQEKAGKRPSDRRIEEASAGNQEQRPEETAGQPVRPGEKGKAGAEAAKENYAQPEPVNPLPLEETGTKAPAPEEIRGYGRERTQGEESYFEQILNRYLSIVYRTEGTAGTEISQLDLSLQTGEEAEQPENVQTRKSGTVQGGEAIPQVRTVTQSPEPVFLKDKAGEESQVILSEKERERSFFTERETAGELIHREESLPEREEQKAEDHQGNLVFQGETISLDEYVPEGRGGAAGRTQEPVFAKERPAGSENAAQITPSKTGEAADQTGQLPRELSILSEKEKIDRYARETEILRERIGNPAQETPAELVHLAVDGSEEPLPDEGRGHVEKQPQEAPALATSARSGEQTDFAGPGDREKPPFVEQTALIKETQRISQELQTEKEIRREESDFLERTRQRIEREMAFREKEAVRGADLNLAGGGLEEAEEALPAGEDKAGEAPVSAGGLIQERESVRETTERVFRELETRMENTGMQTLRSEAEEAAPAFRQAQLILPEMEKYREESREQDLIQSKIQPSVPEGDRIPQSPLLGEPQQEGMLLGSVRSAVGTPENEPDRKSVKDGREEAGPLSEAKTSPAQSQAAETARTVERLLSEQETAREYLTRESLIREREGRRAAEETINLTYAAAKDGEENSLPSGEPKSRTDELPAVETEQRVREIPGQRQDSGSGVNGGETIPAQEKPREALSGQIEAQGGTGRDSVYERELLRERIFRETAAGEAFPTRPGQTDIHLTYRNGEGEEREAEPPRETISGENGQPLSPEPEKGPDSVQTIQETTRRILQQIQIQEQRAAMRPGEPTEERARTEYIRAQEASRENETAPGSAREQEEAQWRELSPSVNQGDIYNIRQSAEETNLYYTGQPASEEQETQEPGDQELLMEQLQEINRRNVENYQRYQQLVQLHRQEENDRKSKEKPAAEKMREESLRALENPQLVIEEHYRKAPQEESRLTAAQQAMEELIPEETRAVYEKVREM